MANEWTKLTASADHSELDRISAIMSMLDNGLMIEDYSDLSVEGMYGALIDDKLLSADKSKISVSIFVPQEKNLISYIEFLQNKFLEEGIHAKLTTEGLLEEDWAESWKQYYKPIHLGRVTVVPAWEKYEPQNNEVIIKMDPGMAFGTGTHETTRLVLSLLDEMMVGGERVLDVGTGSGILAIGASKLGAKECAAYDIDPVAVRVAKENFKDNDCNNITCGVSDLLKAVDLSKGPYDICVANIVADIIIRMAPSIPTYIRSNGLLIVSGIVISRANDVRDALTSLGFSIVKEKVENDWIAIAFKKR